jgi:hypothetical protein
MLVAFNVFAIDIYCPKCKIVLYNYVGDMKPGTTVMAKDFIPVNETIPQPRESERCICPICSANLNGWEYWAEALGRNNHLVFGAISFLTKDEQGNWKWIPYDIDLPEMKELMKE